VESLVYIVVVVLEDELIFLVLAVDLSDLSCGGWHQQEDELVGSVD
jgi:hypothetical protein